MRTLTFLFFAVLGFVFADAKGYAVDPVKDMALIYQGGTHRPDWTVDELTPYVVHTFADGSKDWFFDGFLFLEFNNGSGYGYANGAGHHKSRKEHWEWLLDRVFAKDKSLDALDKCIKKYKKIIGNPSFRHKVVLSLPSALMKQTDWGELNGKKLDFNNQEDQVEAVRWYIDKLLERYNKQGYDNFDLQGLYWIDEDSIHCRNLPARVSDYIHSKGLRFYWIPYFKARGYDKWRELGFDIAYMQPNHFFEHNIPDSRLDEACAIGRANGLAMEFEFDLNVLYNNPNSSYSRMEAYINYFERNQVFKQSAVAYYSGTKGLLEMSRTGVPEDQRLLDRLARIVVSRRTQEPKEFVPNHIVKVSGDNLYVSAKLSESTDIVYHFRKCMFNNLFTFYKVGLVNNSQALPITDFDDSKMKVLNSVQYSDNIGPVGIVGGDWNGGNHSLNEKNVNPTASNVFYSIVADGMEITHSSDTLVCAKIVNVVAGNNILNPFDATRKSILCHEYVNYDIRGGSVQVSVYHSYLNTDTVEVSKYYGMQSMFESEQSIITPNGACPSLTPIGSAGRFCKKDYPDFRHFVEWGKYGCQSSFLLPDGRGDHSSISDSDYIFIGNSNGKNYHKLLGNVKRVKGNYDYWSGVYTWFEKPLLHNESVLAFAGAVEGKAALFVSSPKGGTFTISLTEEMIKNIARCNARGLKYSLGADSITLKLPAGYDGYITF